MNKLILTLSCLLFILKGYTQILNEDAKGKSTILIDGANLSLDLSDPSLGFTVNNFSSLSVDNKLKRSTFLWGFSAYGTNDEGISNLLTDGNLSTSGRLSGVLGFRFSLHSRTDIQTYKDYNALLQIKELKQYNEAGNFFKAIRNTVQTSELPIAKRSKLLERVNKAMNDNVGAGQLTKTIAAMTDLKTREFKDDNESQDILDDIVTDLTTRKTTIGKLETDASYIAAKNGLRAKRSAMSAIASKKKSRLIFYISPGLNAKSFDQYQSLGTGNFSDDFKRRTYRTGFVDLGINYDPNGRMILGLSLGYEKGNTFDSLRRRELTLRNTQTSGNQTLITESKRTAYSGTFDTYDRFNIRFDPLYFARISDEYRMAWNILYVRGIISSDRKIARGFFNVGTGLNFYKTQGKFLGGFYLEEEDAANNLNNENDFFKRIKIGVVAKYAFASILDRNW